MDSLVLDQFLLYLVLTFLLFYLRLDRLSLSDLPRSVHWIVLCGADVTELFYIVGHLIPRYSSAQIPLAWQILNNEKK